MNNVYSSINHFNIWNQTLNTILLYNHVMIGRGQSFPGGYEVLDIVDILLKKYKKISNRMHSEFKFVNQVINRTQDLKTDIQTMIQREFRSINDLDVLVYICSHRLYRTLKKEINICDIVKTRLQTIKRRYKNHIKDEQTVMSMSLKQFMSNAKDILKISKEITKITNRLFCKCLYIEDIKQQLSSLLSSIRSNLFNPCQTNIRRNDDICMDFKSYLSNDTSKNVVDEMCCICLENFTKEDDVVILKCNHNFHRSCISESFKYQQKCPLCRCEIVLSEK